jgi:hypothetical protein
MNDDMNDIEKILWIEKRFGITKTIGENPSNDKVEQTENELLGLLSKYREELRITIPLPKIRMWLTNDKLNFLFYNRSSGKRILLGDWLANKETPYER